jgi:hypothetical protein
VYRATQKGVTVRTMELRDDEITELQKVGIHTFKFVERHYSGSEFMMEAEK